MTMKEKPRRDDHDFHRSGLAGSCGLGVVCGCVPSCPIPGAIRGCSCTHPRQPVDCWQIGSKPRSGGFWTAKHRLVGRLFMDTSVFGSWSSWSFSAVRTGTFAAFAGTVRTTCLSPRGRPAPSTLRSQDGQLFTSGRRSADRRRTGGGGAGSRWSRWILDGLRVEGILEIPLGLGGQVSLGAKKKRNESR